MDKFWKPFLLTCCLAAPIFPYGAFASQPPTQSPSVTALVTNFYYRDLQAAKAWYAGALGFPVIYDDGWVVMVEPGPGMQIALVDGSKGALKPVENKGAMLAIETDTLTQWYDRVSNIDGIEWYPYNDEDPENFTHGIRDHKDYREFRVLDPGGYIIEFYEWKPGYHP